jgi:hypothetical protein
MSFVVILTGQKGFIGLKKSFVLNMPMSKFKRWRNQFYRIGSSILTDKIETFNPSVALGELSWTKSIKITNLI